MVLGLRYHSQQLSQHHSRQKQKGKSEGETQIQEHMENKREICSLMFLFIPTSLLLYTILETTSCNAAKERTCPWPGDWKMKEIPYDRVMIVSSSYTHG